MLLSNRIGDLLSSHSFGKAASDPWEQGIRNPTTMAQMCREFSSKMGGQDSKDLAIPTSASWFWGGHRCGSSNNNQSSKKSNLYQWHGEVVICGHCDEGSVSNLGMVCHHGIMAQDPTEKSRGCKASQGIGCHAWGGRRLMAVETRKYCHLHTMVEGHGHRKNLDRTQQLSCESVRATNPATDIGFESSHLVLQVPSSGRLHHHPHHPQPHLNLHSKPLHLPLCLHCHHLPNQQDTEGPHWE